MLRMLLVLVLLLPLGAVAKTIYKYYDADGNVVFTDQPTPGAEKMVIPEAQTYSAPRQTYTPSLPPMPARNDGSLAPYSQFKIKAPAPDETFRNVEDVLVSLSIMPRLRQGDKVQLVLDGQSVGKPKPSPQFALPGVARGSHTLQAHIIGPQGETVMSSETVSFHMHRSSVLTKPVGPTPKPIPKPGPKINLPTRS